MTSLLVSLSLFLSCQFCSPDGPAHSTLPREFTSDLPISHAINQNDPFHLSFLKIFFTFFNDFYHYAPSMNRNNQSFIYLEDEFLCRLAFPGTIQIKARNQFIKSIDTSSTPQIRACGKQMNCLLKFNDNQQESLLGELQIESFLCEEEPLSSSCEIFFHLRHPKLPHSQEPIQVHLTKEKEQWKLAGQKDIFPETNKNIPAKAFLFDQHLQKELLTTYLEERSEL